MDADFYPRLSAVVTDIKAMNTTINRQVIVCVLIIVPCLMLFCLFLPQIISLLYTDKYHEVIPMVICATFFVFSKAVLTPVAYTSLAKGDAIMFLVIETASAVLLALCVVGGYAALGLTGAGLGLTVSNLLEMLIIFVVYHRFYKVGLNRQTCLVVFAELLMLSAGIALVVFVDNAIIKYGATITLAVIAALLCGYYCFLKKETE